MATAPSSITLIALSASSCWAQVVPSSSAVLMKHSLSTTGWPSTPSSWELMYLTAVCAPVVANGPTCWVPPCWLTQPMVTGGSDVFALPALPPVYFR
jgi:hypothetical protein